MPEAFDDHMTITYNLMHLALQGDISRVFTFMVGHEASDRGYAHIGIPETHHSISHHGNDAEKLAKYAKIGTYQIVKLAEFLEKLKTTKDGDGTLLDHSMLYWGSGMSNGNEHDRSNPPAVIVGGAQRPPEGQPPHRREEGRADREPAARDGARGRRGDRELGASTGRLDKDCAELIAMMQKITGEPPKMWGPSIIGFGSYHYVYDSGREGDMPLTGFSPRKPSLVLYLGSVLKDKTLMSKLGKCKTAGGCLHIKKLDDVDRGVLKTLVTTAVKLTRKKYGA